MRRWEADPLLNGINFSPKVFDARSGKAMEISISYMFNFHCFVRSKWRAIGELSTTSLKFSEVIRLEFSSEVTRWRFHYQEKRNDFL